MEYSSASEGEIVETKATTTHKPGRDQNINGHNRPRSHKSGSARPLYSDHDSDGLDYNDGNASSRAGSPDRRRHNQGTHSLKRRYPDNDNDREHSDPRRFKVHYENGQARGTGHGYDSRRDERRGPGRYDQYDQRNHEHHNGSLVRHRDVREHDSGPATSKYHSELDPLDQSARKQKDAEHGRTNGGSDPWGEKPPLGSVASADRYEIQHQKRGPSLTSRGVREHAAEDVEPAQPKDEAALIEERRKRREALRAKHNRDLPLVQKVLQANASTAQSTTSLTDGSTSTKDSMTPIPSTSLSPNPASPQSTSPSTPQPNSPGSPFEIAVLDDAELANDASKHNVEADVDEGPSAADYDPSMDMQENRVPPKYTSEIATTIQGANNDKSGHPAKHEDEDEGFDMFADDVNIESPTAASKPEDDGIQAVSGLKGKQLDQSMLDDWDDSEGYYRIILGELLDKRYQVHSNLGKGVFSAVVRATDNRTGNMVAIKVIRKQESMYRAGLKEIHTLEKLAEADPEDKRHVIRLERHFMHKGHLCMVFENLSINLREVLKKFGRDVGINIKAVRAYAQQMFLGLSLLKKCEIIHADLKPDNVLVNENRSQLKIADLGSAFDAQDSEVTDTLVSRFYRGPEIMLGLKGDHSLDIWSIGCTLFELYTGRILFTGGSNNQMLKSIMECRGKIPNRVLKRAEYWDQHFEPNGTFLSQEYDAVTRKDVVRPMNIVRTVPNKEIRARVFASAKNLSIAETKELNLFSDLLEKCLAVDPSRRISPNEALRHGFINRSAAPPAPSTKAR